MTPRDREEKSSLLFLHSQRLLDMARRDSLWCLDVETACCGLGALRLSDDGGAFALSPVAPRQADVMIVAGSVNAKMAHELRELYEEMPYPKWVVALGACACDGGPFAAYPNVVAGVGQIVPVDIRVPGCPPTPDAVSSAFAGLRDLVSRRMEVRIADRRG